MIKGVKQTAEYGDNIDKMSQKMGMSAQAYQEWDFIMQHNGTTIESMKASMKTLANAAENNNDAFKRLGITQEQMASMSQEELFGATIKGLQNVTDTTERTYLAGQLLGRGATELGALLNMSAEETEEMRKQVHDLGGVMSDEAVKNAAAFQDSLQNLKTAFGGIKRGITSDFMPSITTVMDGLSAIFSGDDSGLGKVNKGVKEFVDNLNKKIPQIMKVGKSIVKGLGDAIIDNLPLLVSTAADIILALVDFIIDNMPEIIEAAFIIITQLAIGLIKALPELIKKIPEIIKAIAEGLKDGKKEILQALKELIVKPINEKWDEVKKNTKEKWEGIKKDIKGKIQEIKDNTIGKIVELKNNALQKFDDFKTGVKEKFEAIKKKITEPVKEAKDKVKGFIGDIKEFFDGLKISLPHINLPHFKVTYSETGGKLWKALGFDGKPSLSVDWYAKAMNNAMLLDSPTIFGMANGKYLGAGEAGQEVVAGSDTLMAMIKGAVAETINSGAIVGLLSDIAVNTGAQTSININDREFGRLVKGVV